MSKQVKSDGRIQAALLEAFKRNDIGLAKLASWVTRRNLRCCNLKALETILEAWAKKADADYACGDGDATVQALLHVFIEIRRKQSPVWRKEQEGLKQGDEKLAHLARTLAEREAAKLGELDKLLKPAGDAAVSTRRPGMATLAEEIRKWTTDKVASEISKQIRRDFGGRDEKAVIEWMMARWKIDRSTAESMHNFIGTMFEGTRKRVASKVEELKRRAERGDSAARTDS
jgi:hypothetical protein